MAMGGLRPVVAIYSTFLNRAWDQVVYDVALHRLPVVFCLDRAGITGPDGASHHGVYDMAMLARVPGHAGAGAVERPGAAPDAARRHDAGRRRSGRPSATHAGRPARSASTRSASASAPARSAAPTEPPGERVCVLAIGKLVEAAEKAADDARRRGHRHHACGTFAAAPRSTTAMLADAAAHRAVVTCEDGVRDGGIGMTIADRIGALAPAVPVEVLGTPTRFIAHDGRAERILAQLGLDADGISAAVRAFC